MFTMVTSNMFIPELRQKQGWRHEKMKLESTQINDSKLQELESQTRGRVGGGRGLRHPPPKKNPQIPKHCRETSSRSIWR